MLEIDLFAAFSGDLRELQNALANGQVRRHRVSFFEIDKNTRYHVIDVSFAKAQTSCKPPLSKSISKVCIFLQDPTMYDQSGTSAFHKAAANGNLLILQANISISRLLYKKCIGRLTSKRLIES